MTFEDCLPKFGPEIRRMSYTQRIPGMDPDDVESEMLTVLWKATETHDPEMGSLGAYWWTLWSNRRKNLCEHFFATKRAKLVPVEVLPEVPSHQPATLEFPLPFTSLEQMAWSLIADGETPSEVKATLGISNRAYYSLIHAWRTPEVRDFLLR